MKKCFKCGNVKSIDKYYKHPKTKDGYLNKCIDCARKDALINYDKISKSEEWLEKERIRVKDKYYRLNYSSRVSSTTKHIKDICKYNNLHRKLNIPKTHCVHHWNYNYIEDVFIIKPRQHKRIHKYLKLDKLTSCFYNKEGILLDTRKKHEIYINEIIKLN